MDSDRDAYEIELQYLFRNWDEKPRTSHRWEGSNNVTVMDPQPRNETRLGNAIKRPDEKPPAPRRYDGENTIVMVLRWNDRVQTGIAEEMMRLVEEDSVVRDRDGRSEKSHNDDFAVVARTFWERNPRHGT